MNCRGSCEIHSSNASPIQTANAHCIYVLLVYNLREYFLNIIQTICLLQITNEYAKHHDMTWIIEIYSIILNNSFFHVFSFIYIL